MASETRWRQGAARAARAALVASLYTLVPFVVFFNIARLQLDSDLGLGILLAYAALGLTWVAALAGARALGLGRPGRGALINSALMANTGYLGYPLCAALLGFDSLGQAVAYDILVSAPIFLLIAFGVGAAYGDRAGETGGARLRAFFTRNPPLLAAVAGLLAPDALAPDALLDASRVAVVALLPLGFFAVGAALTEEAELEGDGHRMLRPRADVATAVALRLALAPALLFALALPLIDLPDPYLLLAAMPCGINTVVVAHVYGLDGRLTASAVAWSTALVVIGASVAAAAT